MKKTVSIILVISLILGSATFIFAEGFGVNKNPDGYSTDLCFTRQQGVRTEITDIFGKTQSYDGILDVASLEQSKYAGTIASYDIIVGEETVLSVVLHDIISSQGKSTSALGVPARTQSGFYSVEFDIDATHRAFLTGLSSSNVSSVQTELVGSRFTDSGFSMTDLDFIDAEKNYSFTNESGYEDTDEEMCWAATTSNLLHYTGWGKLAGFGSSDYIFEKFNDRFTDNGGAVTFGIQWFFNGYYEPYGWDGWAQPVSYDGSFTGYLNQYCVDELVSGVSVQSRQDDIADVYAALRNECGVGISIGWMKNANRYGGHAISLWGYIEDTSKPSSDKARNCALIVSDSDSDISIEKERREAPNKLRVMNMTAYEADGYDTWTLDYENSYAAVLEEFTVLQPYSASVPTEGSGSRNVFTHADLSVLDINVTQSGAISSDNWFDSAGNIYVYPSFINRSAASIPVGASFGYTIEILQGSTVIKTVNDTAVCAAGLDPGYYTNEDEVPYASNIGKLSAGSYTVRVTIDNSISESYCNNNVSEKDITVFGGATALSAVPDFSEGSYAGKAYLTLTGIPADYDPMDYTVYASYYDGEDWSDPEELYRGAAMPETVGLRPSGVRVQYSVRIRSNNAENREILLYSEPADLSYILFTAFTTGTNTKYCTMLPLGATSLANGEYVSARIENTSTVSGSADYEYFVYLQNISNSEDWYQIASGTGSLAKGQTSSVLRFNSWSQSVAANLNGTYCIRMQVGFTDAEGKAWYPKLNMGFVQVLGTAYSGKIDSVDHYEAFKTVVIGYSVAPFNTTFKSFIEYGLDENDTVRSAVRSRDANEWFGYGELHSLDTVPGRIYRYRSVVADGAGNVQACSDWGQFTAENLLDVITDPVVKDISLGDEAAYSYVADSRGTYTVSVSGGYARVSYYCDENMAWFSEDVYNTGCINVPLEADEILVIRVKALSRDSSYTISVAKAVETDDFVLGEAVPVSVTPYIERISVKADVPGGLSGAIFLGVEYREKGKAVSRILGYDCTEFNGGTVAKSVDLTVTPGAVCECRTFLQVYDPERAYFGDWVEFTAAEEPSIAYTDVVLGTQNLTLAAGNNYYYRFTPATAGAYTMTVSGPDGYLEIWDSSAGDWVEQMFGLPGTSSVFITDSAWTFMIHCYSGGDYELTIALSSAVDDDNICINSLSLNNQYGRACDSVNSGSFSVVVTMTQFSTVEDVILIVSGYDAAGRMVECNKYKTSGNYAMTSFDAEVDFLNAESNIRSVRAMIVDASGSYISQCGNAVKSW